MFQLVHALSRGVDKRNIFLDERDYFRFIHDLFEFNNQEWVDTTFYAFKKNYDIESRNISRKKRKLLVSIHAFCLMPNHYHLLLSPKIERGISKFMQKVNMGYAKYFNQKYKRTGALFESRYKAVPVLKEEHFIYLPYYIHLNPLDLIAPEWREGKLRHFKKAINFLESYRWSSHLDYLEKKNFPSILFKDFLSQIFKNKIHYREIIYKWLKELNLNQIKEVILE